MRGLIKGLAGFIILLVLAWLGLWVYAEMRLKQFVAAEINQANASGTVQISYDKLTTSSSPFVASVALANPSWTSKPGAGASAASVHASSFGVHVNIFAPLLLHVDIPQTITITTPEASGALTFAVADVTENLSPSLWTGNMDNPLTGGDAHFAGINLLASNGSLQVAQIDSLVFQEAVNAKAARNQTAISIKAEMNHFQLSPIITRLINLPFKGQIAYLAFAMRLSGPLDWQSLAKQLASLPPGEERTHFMLQSLHQWALAGGRGQGKLTLALGPSQLKADGSVSFDSAAQPSGAWNLTASHLDQLTSAITTAYPALQGGVSQLEARVSPYLTTSQAGGQELTVNTAFGKGGVTTNGQKTGEMPPLDWTKLLNPPPAPPTAPGDGSGAASP